MIASKSQVCTVHHSWVIRWKILCKVSAASMGHHVFCRGYVGKTSATYFCYESNCSFLLIWYIHTSICFPILQLFIWQKILRKKLFSQALQCVDSMCLSTIWREHLPLTFAKKSLLFPYKLVYTHLSMFPNTSNVWMASNFKVRPFFQAWQLCHAAKVISRMAEILKMKPALFQT